MNKFLLFSVILFSIRFGFSQSCASSVVPPAVVNGVNVTASSTGSVSTYSSPFNSCSTTTPANSVWLGSGGSFSYTLFFDQPVNDVLIALTATGQGANENFIFTTNAGIPTISVQSNCFSNVTGNEILSGAGAGSGGGGGEFVITASTSFTSITITGSGGQNGALLSICSNSIVIDNCNAGSAAPNLSSNSILNNCGQTSADLTTITADNTPPGTTLSWHTDVNASSTNMIAGTAVGDGTYYAAFYDAVNDCFSTNTSGVQVTSSSNPLNAGPDIEVCLGESITLAGSNGSAFVWDNGVIDGVSFAPLSTTTYTLSGLDLNNCPGSDQVLVTVYDLPIVDAGSDITVCLNSSVNLSATGALTYLWDNGVIDGVSFTALSTSTYTVIGTDANGCENSDNVLVTINSLPTVNAGNDTTVCENELLIFTGNGNAVNYTWDNGISDGIAFSATTSTIYTVTGIDANGCESQDQLELTVNPLPNVSAGNDFGICIGETATLSASGAQTFTWDNGISDGLEFTPTSSLIYTVIGIDINGCENSDQIELTVNNLPIIDAGADFTVCENSSITLSGNGGISYQWDNNVFDNVPFTISNTTSYTVVGTDANGCQNIDDIRVNVNSLPTVNAGGDFIICENEQVVLNGSGAVNYTWDNGVTNALPFNLASTTNFTVTGTDANGCIDTDQVLVTVNALPNINAGNDIAICIGETVTLIGSGGLNYMWDNGIVNNIPFSPSTSLTYQLTGVDANGCINTDDVLVTVNPLPNVDAGADLIICINDPVILTATGAMTYTWDNDVINGAIFYPSNSGSYTVVGVDANSCVNFDQVDVIVNPIPTASFVIDPAIVDELNPTILPSNNSVGASSFIWSFGDGSISIVEEPIYSYVDFENGDYLVSLIAINDFNCSDTAYFNVEVEEVLLHYIPNTFTPNGDEINNTFKPIFNSVFDPEEYQLLVYNRWGELIFESLDYKIGWDGTFKNQMSKSDLYTWQLKFRSKKLDEVIELSGSVNLLK